MTAESWVDRLTWHAASGSLFDPQALCGVTADLEPDGQLRLHSSDVHVTCLDCRAHLLTQERP